MVDRSRRPTSALAAAESAFRAATTRPAEEPPKPPVIPHAKEAVSLHIDRDALHYFPSPGRGCKERINAAHTKPAGLSPAATSTEPPQQVCGNPRWHV